MSALLCYCCGFSHSKVRGATNPKCSIFLLKSKFGPGKNASVARKVRKIFATFTPCKVKSFNKKFIDFEKSHNYGTPDSKGTSSGQFLLKQLNLLVHNQFKNPKCIAVRGSACTVQNPNYGVLTLLVISYDINFERSAHF